jgi:hypothetical protein
VTVTPTRDQFDADFASYMRGYRRVVPGVLFVTALATCALVVLGAASDKTVSIYGTGPPLDNTECARAWAMASRTSSPVPFEKAEPYVLDFTVIDVDRDGKISEQEFKDACRNGWVKHPAG